MLLLSSCAETIRKGVRLACLASVCTLVSSALSATPPEETAFFEKHIRPILIERCYSCHSAEGKQKGGLRLDVRAGWAVGGDSGPAIVPGSPERSRLIEAVHYNNTDLAMPPKGRLPKREIELLSRWVAMGAPDPRDGAIENAKQEGLTIEEGKAFWSYRVPEKSVPPSVTDTSWARSPLDTFLLARMEEKGLRPNVDADRSTLLRRLYFDLVGLPPPQRAMERFLKDERPEALAEIVDELFGSPRFGERWARHWLDVTRYADSVVLRGLLLKNAWRYRDYVIAAFNDDMPFDQFVREQLAGDLLSGGDLADRQRRRVATTFYSLGDHTLESQDKTQLDMDVIDEQLDVIGKAFLGQTITCARCHDHKFDPIPTTDYYAMAGILRGIDTLKHSNVSGWVEMPLPLKPEEEKAHKQHSAQVTALEKEVKAAKSAVAALTPKKKKSAAKAGQIVAPTSFAGIVIDEREAKAVGEWMRSQWTQRYIGDGYLHDKAEGKGAKSLTFTPKLPRPGVYEVRFAYTPGTNRSTNVPVTVVSSEGEKTTIINQKKEPPLEGRWVRLGRFRFDRGQPAAVRVDTKGSTETVTVDAVQFVSPQELAAKKQKSPAKTEKPKAAKPDEQAAARATATARLKDLEAKLKTLKSKAPSRPMVLTVREKKAQDIPVHVRGSVHNLGPKPVPRGFLSVTIDGPAPVLPKEQSGRLELAEWIASSQNPLTARVIVNRVWHWLFGAGLVRTPDNFGTTGQAPTHPKLLDWLAVRFMEERWSVKWLVREIVFSRAYGMSSRIRQDSEGMRVDPDNHLLWHRGKRQLEAECIRDSMLAASGELTLEMNGRTFPASLKADYSFRFDKPRRSIYVPVFRNARPEIFEVFDGANMSMVTGKRDASTVAPQALFLLNHPFVHAESERTAKRILAAQVTSREGILRAYALVLGRAPSERELALALRWVETAAAGDREKVWTRLVHALYNSLDFRYLH